MEVVRCETQVGVVREFLRGYDAASDDGRLMCFHGTLWAGLEPIGRMERGAVVLPMVPGPWLAARVQALEREAEAAGKEVRYEVYSSHRLVVAEEGAERRVEMKKCRSQVEVMREFLRGYTAVSADGRLRCFRGTLWAGLDQICRMERGALLLPMVPGPWLAAPVQALEREAKAAGKEVQYEVYSTHRS